MILDWQNTVVLTLVGVAAGYIAWRGWLAIARKSSSSCGGCGSCPSEQTTGSVKSAQFVPIEEVKLGGKSE